MLEIAKQEGLNRYQLAKRLGISIKELSLVQRANLETNTETIYKIAKAISKEVEIRFE